MGGCLGGRDLVSGVGPFDRSNFAHASPILTLTRLLFTCPSAPHSPIHPILFQLCFTGVCIMSLCSSSMCDAAFALFQAGEWAAADALFDDVYVVGEAQLEDPEVDPLEAEGQVSRVVDEGPPECSEWARAPPDSPEFWAGAHPLPHKGASACSNPMNQPILRESGGSIDEELFEVTLESVFQASQNARHASPADVVITKPSQPASSETRAVDGGGAALAGVVGSRPFATVEPAVPNSRPASSDGVEIIYPMKPASSGASAEGVVLASDEGVGSRPMSSATAVDSMAIVELAAHVGSSGASRPRLQFFSWDEVPCRGVAWSWWEF